MQPSGQSYKLIHGVSHSAEVAPMDPYAQSIQSKRLDGFTGQPFLRSRRLLLPPARRHWGLPVSTTAFAARERMSTFKGMLFWLFKGDLKVRSGTVYLHRSSYGTNFDTSEIASPALGVFKWYRSIGVSRPRYRDHTLQNKSSERGIASKIVFMMIRIQGAKHHGTPRPEGSNFGFESQVVPATTKTMFVCKFPLILCRALR